MDRLRATYRVVASTDEIDAIALALALEQSVEVPLAAVHEEHVRDHIVGRVAEVRAAVDGAFEVDVDLAVATTGLDVAQTVNMLFGNSSLHSHVQLIDVDFPQAFVDRWRGPRFGIAGLREQTGVTDRALTCAALKPQGLPSEALARLAYALALGGVDVIKDDHGLADQAYSPFFERVRACQRAVEAAMRDTGRRVLYAPSLVGSPARLAEQLRVVREEGVGMVLIAPALVGLPSFAALIEMAPDVPVLAHPAYAGAVGVAPPFLLGRLFRLLGADAVIYPNYGGRFSFSKAQCLAIAAAARANWTGVASAMPVPAGGMTIERVDEMLECYGRDAMLLIGGALLTDPLQVTSRASAFTTKVAASSAGKVS